ncbi:MAG TPA: TetR/AcrR family transcriptional regulator [Thermoanaerobaculia bacterium]|nr:TetR/AcrR family transcriptional regulator [Thermoanaerobaculia bacterium]
MSSSASRRPASTYIESKRQAKRMKILESAVKSFARRGFYGTSMDDIADDLRLTRGSLYYYFQDKEEILALCHLVALEAVNRTLDRVRAERLQPAEAVRRLVVEHVRVMVDRFHGTALALEVDALDEARRREVVDLRDRFESGLREVVADGVERGVFRAVDPKLTAFAMFGAINWVGRWYRPGGGTDPETIGQAFADLFLSGLEVRR